MKLISNFDDLNQWSQLSELELPDLTVTATEGGRGLSISYDGQAARVSYDKKNHLCRALGLLKEKLSESKEPFTLHEEPVLSEVGIMLDTSRNAVMNVRSICSYLDKLALMGYDYLMLYTEDMLTVPEYPYFGYMRGRYTPEEIKEVDRYAAMLGIELIPCIETLGHLERTLSWFYADDFRDDPSTVMVGEPKTYEFIEAIIRACSEQFTSKKIHLGLDETYGSGRGAYMDKYGYRDSKELFVEHSSKVIDIAHQYGFEPMVYSDMMQKSLPDYGEKLKPALKGAGLVYWNYMLEDVEAYKADFQKQAVLGGRQIYCGSAWTFSGCCPDYKKAINSSSAGIQACKELGMDSYYVSLWGDGGAETDLFSALLIVQLYAEHKFHQTVDMALVEKRVKACTGYDAAMLWAIANVDNVDVYDRNPEINPSYYVMWQDLLYGFLDKHLAHADMKKHFEQAAAALAPYRKEGAPHDALINRYLTLCEAAGAKAEIGILMKRCYDAHDMEGLKEIAAVRLPQLKEKVKAAHKAYHRLWLEHNKAFGMEIQDIRYGGLLARIDTAIERIEDFCAGRITEIEELAAERLYQQDTRENQEHKNYIPWAGYYVSLATMGRIN